LNLSSGDGTVGALAAQSGEASGLSLRYNDLLSLSAYNNNTDTKRIFHLDANGNLSIGYKTFVMSGHITEGANYLERTPNG